MRQAGLKPKSHSSGVYWLRAASGNDSGEVREKEGFGIVGSIFFVIFLPIVLVLIFIEKLMSR